MASYGKTATLGGSEATIFDLPLSTAWNAGTTNLSGLFSQTSDEYYKPINVEDGVMFATDNDLLLYGGLTRPTDTEPVPGPQDVLGVQLYHESSNQSNSASKFFNTSLPDGITRYITNGAGENIPSENMGYYLGGMRGTTWGPITLDDASANTTADNLISVNMTNIQSLDWQNATLPTFVSPRAHAELVWVPTSEKGLLVVIGGVVYPGTVFPAGLSNAQESINNLTDPNFMKTIGIYDIANQTWCDSSVTLACESTSMRKVGPIAHYRSYNSRHLQNTTGDIPPATALFCSVLASAEDGSSHNIYIYGGNDGSDNSTIPFDDVYILSLPSFVWIKAYSGIPRHGRSGHQCFRVFPDQMLVLGGLFQDPSLCLEGGVLQLFNLNTLNFQDSYDPSSYKSYTVPDIVTRQIGGSGNGGANRTSPEKWTSSDLEALFSVPYTKPIPSWYPYAASDNTTNTPAAHGEGQNKIWVIAVAVGLSIPGASVVGLWMLFYYKRKKNHKSWLDWIRFRKAPLVEAGGTEIYRNQETVRDKSNGTPAELDGTPPSPQLDVTHSHNDTAKQDAVQPSPGPSFSCSATPRTMYGPGLPF